MPPCGLIADCVGQKARLRLDDGSERRVDHARLATGYRVDISHCSYLGPDLLHSLRAINGYPELTAGFEASLPGLHFLGASAAGTLGPLIASLQAQSMPQAHSHVQPKARSRRPPGG
jgi:FAD-dependent urate hydroxylase